MEGEQLRLRAVPTRGRKQVTNGAYVPAAGRAWLTRLYDPAVALTMREKRFRGLLLEQVSGALGTRGTIVDVGAGTGSFAIQVATALPEAEVIAVDGDEEVLAVARAKSGAHAVEWRPGLANSLPVPDGSADAVVMSLLLHHLDPPGKHDALAEARRVLRPGGTLHIADWGRPHDPMMRAAFLLLQTLDGFPNTRDHVTGRLPEFVAAAGFHRMEVTSRLRTAWGTLEIARST